MCAFIFKVNPHIMMVNYYFQIYLCFFYVYECLFACTCVHNMHVWCMRWPEEDIRSPGPRVRDGCEAPSECWKSNPGPLQK